MVRPGSDVILVPEAVSVGIGLEPAHNVLASLAFLADADNYPGVDHWIVQTNAALSPELRSNNQLIFNGLYDLSSLVSQSWPSFPAYLDDLRHKDPYVLRDRLLKNLCCTRQDLPSADPAYLLSSFDTYVERIRKAYGPDLEIDRGILSEGYALLQDPPAMLDLLVSHLQRMWDEWLAPEWERVKPTMQVSVEAFQRLDYSGLTVFEAIRLVTGRDLRGYLAEEMAGVEHIIFAPSAHTGPYIAHFRSDKTIWMIFGARLPREVPSFSPTLNRSELLVRLNALADDTRLRILELLTQHKELCAQEVMQMLDLSQSSASRHLRQLSATGYLNERRREVGKCYSLNPDRVEDTLWALQHFLLKH